jgi:HlyD family secretion protein
MSIRLSAGILLASALVAGSFPMAGSAGRSSGANLLIPAAQAQSVAQSPAARVQSAVQTLIARLRGRTMPEGIVKSNSRIEATQVDVAAKYAGRIATMTVDEGDEVTAGQVVATIPSPEYEAQLRGAQAQVLSAKQALAEAVALIAQRNSDLNFARADFERGKRLLERGNITQQAVDQRRNNTSRLRT